MEVEHSFYSFKTETKLLVNQWKNLVSRPYENMGQKLARLQHKHPIGEITISELSPFEPKFIFDKE